MNLSFAQTCTSFEHHLIFIGAIITFSLALYVWSTDVKIDEETGKPATAALTYRTLSGLGLFVSSYMLYKFCV